MSGNKVVATSWPVLMDILAQDTKHFTNIDRHRSDKLTGEWANANCRFKVYKRVNKTAFVQVEKHLLRNFQKYAPQHSVIFDTF